MEEKTHRPALTGRGLWAPGDSAVQGDTEVMPVWPEVPGGEVGGLRGVYRLGCSPETPPGTPRTAARAGGWGR